MAANNGVNDRVFHRHGRWKSEQAEDTYVEDNLEQRLEVFILFGGIISPSIVRLAQKTCSTEHYYETLRCHKL